MKLPKIRLAPSGYALLVLALALAIQTMRLHGSQRAARDNWFRADRAEALLDTTRVVNAAAQRVLGDSLLGVERRAIQERQRGDALDRALHRERLAHVVSTVTVAKLDTSTVGTNRDSANVRLGTFHIQQVPYTIDALVALPPPPEPGEFRLRIALDPIPLALRLGCHPKDAQGLRKASVTALGPVWATIALDSVSQAPEICNPPPRRRGLFGTLLRVAAGVGIGYLIAR